MKATPEQCLTLVLMTTPLALASDDTIAAESPVIDLTAAVANGETRLEVTTTYTYNDLLIHCSLEYYDADADAWVLWEQFEKTRDEPKLFFCFWGRDYFASTLLDVSGLPPQTSGI